MKRYFATLLVLCMMIGTQSVFAQLSIKKGLKAGLNVSNFRADTDEGEELKTKNGFNGGVYLEIDPIGPLSFQGEALFTQKGGKLVETDGSNEAETTLKVNYFEIPVLVKLQVPVAPPLVSSNFYAGPAFAFKASESADYKLNGEDVDVEDSEDLFKGSDMGAVVGASMSFSTMGLASVFIDLRYTLGLSNIIKEEFQENDDDTAKNGVISLSVGLGF
ncbi:MAG: PorT family protein [Calditrichaeota bacterium]|nr:PorT family protein [Calditrichota bacterium]MCB9070735.1 PorT family protein [Calditrichia bacterium]